jgi:hypothetical protein
VPYIKLFSQFLSALSYYGLSGKNLKIALNIPHNTQAVIPIHCLALPLVCEQHTLFDANLRHLQFILVYLLITVPML